MNLEVGTTDNDVANFMLANSEGEHSSGKTTNPLSGKHNPYPAGNACAPAHGSKIGGMGVAINTTAPPTTTRYEDTGVPRMPKKKLTFMSLAYVDNLDLLSFENQNSKKLITKPMYHVARACQ